MCEICGPIVDKPTNYTNTCKQKKKKSRGVMENQCSSIEKKRICALIRDPMFGVHRASSIQNNPKSILELVPIKI